MRREYPKIFRWTKSSYAFLSVFLALLALIGYVWWPLVVDYLSTYNPEISFWRQMDWLLLGNFLVMSLLITANADIKRDLPIVLIGFMGGLVIEGWGTQTSLWVYYTNERPPLWIIPAWPIASLSIDRLFRVLKVLFDKVPDKYFRKVYWVMFIDFSYLMVQFVMPSIHASLTLMALFVTCFLILTPRDHRESVLVFAAGSGLGYFLELWGTTRYCWVYYTLQTPPFFAILAHGMAAFAFWRVLKLYEIFVEKRKNPSTLQ